MIDCKTCAHATVLYVRGKEDRHTTVYAPFGKVCCAGPRYRGRSFIVKDTRVACMDYEKRERRAK